jgi:mycobactin lysine-N-oxygenase
VDADLIIVGAGAKAAAIATKVHVINSLGLGPLSVTIVEAVEPAASWTGRNGMTSGEEPLAIPPIKDVGFPYESSRDLGEMGDAVDHAMLAFTWQQYMIGKRQYARWINANAPAVQHRDYGHYLAWVMGRATNGVTHVRGRVTQIALVDADGAPPPGGSRNGAMASDSGWVRGDGGRPHGDSEQAGDGGEPGAAPHWVVDVSESSGSRRYTCGALALTGPGVHRLLPHDPDAAPRIFHCDSRRSEFTRIPAQEPVEIGIVGGGESALSAVAFLRIFRPEAQLTVYTTGLPLSRGESFLENRVFSNPDEVQWSALDLASRRDFVKHCDRGVFDAGSLALRAYDDNCKFVLGRVVRVAAASPQDGLNLQFTSAELEHSARHDYVVNCTGFDLLEQLRGLFPMAARAEIERQVGRLWDAPADSEVPIGRQLELRGMEPRLHIPGLAGLSQGPGFANLGCLGLLANRVLAPLLTEVDVGAHSIQTTTTEVV